MEVTKVNFGGVKPPEIEYTPTGNGADVWLYANVTQETGEQGEISYSADAVHFSTTLSKEEVLAQKDSYFKRITTKELEDSLEQAKADIDFITMTQDDTTTKLNQAIADIDFFSMTQGGDE